MLRLSRWLLAAALTLPWLAAYGQETGPNFYCGSVIEYMGVLRQVQGAPGVKVEQIEAAEAKAFMDRLNEQEPVTDYKADIVVFVIGPENGTITLVRNDKACTMARVQPTPAGTIALQPLLFPSDAMRGMLLYVRQKVGTPA